jgi:hypothetical protein
MPLLLLQELLQLAAGIAAGPSPLLRPPELYRTDGML